MVPEFEWFTGLAFGVLYLNDPDPNIDGTQIHRFSYGQALSDRWFAEAYLIAGNDSGGCLLWQVGVIFGIDGLSPSQSLIALLEYEF